MHPTTLSSKAQIALSPKSNAQIHLDVSPSTPTYRQHHHQIHRSMIAECPIFKPPSSPPSPPPLSRPPPPHSSPPSSAPRQAPPLTPPPPEASPLSSQQPNTACSLQTSPTPLSSPPSPISPNPTLQLRKLSFRQMSVCRLSGAGTWDGASGRWRRRPGGGWRGRKRGL